MTASIIYNGALRCTSVHLQSGTQIETDAPTDNRGKGERFSPTDLTATSLGLCLITTVGIKAMDMGISIEGSEVDVTKHMSKEPPRRIVQIDVQVRLKAENVSEKDKQILENTGNTCPVARSLHPEITQNITYQWPD
ncbi:MAG: OsmC family protein [Chitinophagaceae bacterium]|nr:OsmC family protein [Chitinophagaceae bacterium]